MATFDRTFTVSGSPEATLEYLVDHRNAATWDPRVVASALVGDEPIGVGAGFDATLTFYTKEIPLRFSVEEFVPGRRAVLAASSKRATATERFTVTATGAGETTVEYHADFTLGGMLRFFDRGLQVAVESIGKRAEARLVKELA